MTKTKKTIISFALVLVMFTVFLPQLEVKAVCGHNNWNTCCAGENLPTKGEHQYYYNSNGPYKCEVILVYAKTARICMTCGYNDTNLVHLHYHSHSALAVCGSSLLPIYCPGP